MGIIILNSPMGTALRFTSDRFAGWLWHTDNDIFISFIESLQPGRGHLSALFSEILRRKLTIKVPTPLAHMEAIVRAKGFKQTFVYDDRFGEDVEIWVKEPDTPKEATS